MCKVNLSGVSVQQRLHGHTERIHSLAWQPSRKAYDLATIFFFLGGGGGSGDICLTAANSLVILL